MSDRQEQAREYRAKADEFEAKAKADPSFKTDYLYLAEQYRRLAEEMERGSR